MLFAAFVLLASSGFTVYKHHCSQMNTTQVSYIVDLTECAHIINDAAKTNNHNGSCCSSQVADIELEESHERGCCSHHSETKEGEPISCEVILDDGGFSSCCNTEARYYKLIEKFEVQPVQGSVSLNFIPVLLAVLEMDEDLALLPGKFQQQIISDSGPPLLYGKALVQFTQQYKYHI